MEALRIPQHESFTIDPEFVACGFEGKEMFTPDADLEEVDPEVAEIIKNEKHRQVRAASSATPDSRVAAYPREMSLCTSADCLPPRLHDRSMSWSSSLPRTSPPRP